MRNILIGAMCSVSVIFYTSCGSKSANTGLGDSFSGLSSIPSVAGLIKQNDSASVSLESHSLIRNVDLFEVTGTPPTIAALGASGSLVDSAFFEGAVAAITTAQTATQAQKDSFWKGQGGCWLAQSVGENLGRMLQAGTSMCYLKKVPEKDGVITVVSGSVPDVKQIFNQDAADKVIRADISEQGQTEKIFIKVFGSNSVGSGVYKVQLYFCRPSTVMGSETIIVDKDNSTYTADGTHSEENGRGIMKVIGSLRLNGSTVEFDPTKTRTSTASFTGSWGTYKGKLEISGDNRMVAWGTHSGSYEGTVHSQRNYSVASFSGSSMSDLRFREGASKGRSSHGNQTHNYLSAVEYSSTKYAPISSGTSYDAANAADLDEAFYSSAVEAIDHSAFSCAATPDIVVTMDMATAAMKEISTTCEADRFDNYGMCNSGTIEAVRRIIQQ